MESDNKVILYIDNSNIFINAQQHAATIRKLRVFTDTRCRIDLGKLVDLACSSRTILSSRLYGSEPPALDTVWKAIRGKKIEVKHFKRSLWNNREKETDTTLTADAVDDLVHFKDSAGINRAMILFSGDKDMLPTLHKAQKHKWNVEIWSFKGAIANELLQFKKMNSSEVIIKYVDDHFNQITYMENRWDYTRFRIPADRTMVLKFETKNWEEKRWNEVDRFLDKILNKVVEFSSNLFRIPTKACWNDEFDDSKDCKSRRSFYDLALICIPPEKKEDRKQLYDFNDLFQLRNSLREKFVEVGCIQILSYPQFHEKTKAYDTYDSELEDINNAPIEEFSSGMGWKVVAPKQRRLAQKYSDECSHKFQCKMGLACKYSHSDQQKAYFKEQPDPSRRRYYKTKPCFYHDACKYKRSAHLCSYAHNLNEAICLICDTVGLHWLDDCPDDTKHPFK